MNSLALLLALPLLAGCGGRADAPGEYESLEYCVTECVDAAFSNCPNNPWDVNYSYGPEHLTINGKNVDKMQYKEWHKRLLNSEAEMADRVSDLRDLLLTKLEEAGARIGSSATKRTADNRLADGPDSLFGFRISYTSASEEGQIWVRRVNHGPQVRRGGDADNSIFIVFHGVKTN